MRCTAVRFGFVVWIAMASSAAATTFPNLSFSDLVENSEIVIEGKVIDLQTTATGSPRQGAKEKQHQPPRVPGPGASQPGSSDLPQAVGTEGGRMLFTWVTMEVEEEIAGQAGARISFKVAGGSDDKMNVVVHGMPTFKLGERYIVFLRHNFDQAGDPFAGVNQGFFRVAFDEERGRDILLDAEGDLVIAIEQDRIIRRFNPERAAGPAPQFAPAPTPEPGSAVRSETSSEAARYWTSAEEPISKSAFISAIRASKEAK